MILHGFLVFVAMTIGDVCWARYVSHAAKANRWRAAGWSVALYLCGAFTIVSYTGDHRYLLPAALGAFVGTAIGVKSNQSTTSTN